MSTGRGTEAELAERQALMRVCAEASEAELEAAVAGLGDVPPYQQLRAPETGLVMLRGRTGGNGQPFNLGEAIVTRAAVQLQSGTIGFSYLLGRSERRAQLAALIDALGQEGAPFRDQLSTSLVEPVLARCASQRAATRAGTASTKVNFFTLVRGED